ncbi:MAG: GNAT family N-acetyltransferase [Bdellovibrio sp.]|nr:GNAT family N-acetyltransferase [Bdellovibrio sp.]
MHVEKISFEVIKKFWSEHLWPGRQSPIEPVSCVNSSGTIDLTVRSYHPFFWGAFADSQLLGVVSFSQTSPSEARMRGICVHPDHRGQGVSRRLFDEGRKDAVGIPSLQRLWTMGRLINIDYYGKLGFMRGIEVNAYEFGPHNIMFLDLKKES